MNTLNENIVRLRKQAGMTQEELGRRVMASTQAVSRWERGGSPDIALLPAIAQVFSVTLDELFGRESEKTIPVEEMLTRDIQSAPETERFERAWRLCWHIMKAVAAADNGPSGDAYFRFMSGSEDVERKNVPEPEFVPSVTYFTHDTGVMSASVARDFHYLLLMPEPEDGFSSVLKCPEAYREFFAFLSRPHYVEMLAMLYSQEPERYFTVSLAAQQLGISQQEAEEILSEFYTRRLVQDTPAKSPEGTVHIYRKLDDFSAIPFLYFAAELMRAQSMFCTILMRQVPFFAKPIGTDSLSPNWVSRDEMNERLNLSHPGGCDRVE